MVRSLDELLARADEFADRFETYEPTAEDFEKPVSPVIAVRIAAYKRLHAERELAEAVKAAREQDVSWRELGEALGTSGEAARQRYAGL